MGRLVYLAVGGLAGIALSENKELVLACAVSSFVIASKLECAYFLRCCNKQSVGQTMPGNRAHLINVQVEGKTESTIACSQYKGCAFMKENLCFLFIQVGDITYRLAELLKLGAQKSLDLEFQVYVSINVLGLLFTRCDEVLPAHILSGTPVDAFIDIRAGIGRVHAVGSGLPR
jgi:hypothetical protein